MYLDLIANSSYGRYNKKLAKVIGLEGACYWDYLAEVAIKAVKKKIVDDEGYFQLNRNQIQEDTLLTKDQQTIYEALFVKLGCFQNKPGSASRVRCDFAKYSYIMIEDQIPQKVIEEILEIRNNQEKVLAELKLSAVDRKRASIIKALKEHTCKVERDPDLQAAYCNLIDVLYDKGICRSCQIDLFMTGINTYTQTKNVKLEIIKIATMQSLRDPAWAIGQYEKTKKERGTTLFAPPQVDQQMSYKNKVAF
jgi:hypothetical protein